MTSSIGFDGDSTQIRSAVRAALHQRSVASPEAGSWSTEPVRSPAVISPGDALIAVVRPHDAPADGNQIDHRSDRRHPRRERHGLASFERTDDPLERHPRRCAVVVVSLHGLRPG